MSVFSTRLYAAVASATTQTAFTVPTGKRVVIRFIYMKHTVAGGTGMIVYLASPPLEVFRAVPSPDLAALGVEVRLTFHEGETCQVRPLGQPAVVSLNGFILDGGGGPLSSGAVTKPGGGALEPAP